MDFPASADRFARAVRGLRVWMTAQVIGAGMLAILVIAIALAMSGRSSPRSAAFRAIDQELANGSLTGLTTAQLLAKYGPAGKDDQGRLTFRTGAKLGRPLDYRYPEILVVRIENDVVAEAGLGEVPSRRLHGPR